MSLAKIECIHGFQMVFQNDIWCDCFHSIQIQYRTTGCIQFMHPFCFCFSLYFDCNPDNLLILDFVNVHHVLNASIQFVRVSVRICICYASWRFVRPFIVLLSHWHIMNDLWKTVLLHIIYMCTFLCRENSPILKTCQLHLSPQSNAFMSKFFLMVFNSPAASPLTLINMLKNLVYSFTRTLCILHSITPCVSIGSDRSTIAFVHSFSLSVSLFVALAFYFSAT